MPVDLGTSLRCGLSGLCERDNVLTAHAAAQDLEHGVAGRSIERGRVSLMRRWECGGAALRHPTAQTYKGEDHTEHDASQSRGSVNVSEN
jgi:hypothetical protein